MQFIEQQEERYQKARIECLKLLEELQKFKDYQDQENAKLEEADEKMAKAEQILKEAESLAAKKRGQSEYWKSLNFGSAA